MRGASMGHAGAVHPAAARCDSASVVCRCHGDGAAASAGRSLLPGASPRRHPSDAPPLWDDEGGGRRGDRRHAAAREDAHDGGNGGRPPPFLSLHFPPFPPPERMEPLVGTLTKTRLCAPPGYDSDTTRTLGRSSLGKCLLPTTHTFHSRHRSRATHRCTAVSAASAVTGEGAAGAAIAAGPLTPSTTAVGAHDRRTHWDRVAGWRPPQRRIHRRLQDEPVKQPPHTRCSGSVTTLTAGVATKTAKAFIWAVATAVAAVAAADATAVDVASALRKATAA